MSVTRKGKERNLSDYNMDELEQMLARTLTLLNEPRLAQSLPGGVEGVQTRRSNIENRISELQDVKQIGKRLDGTHLEGDPPDPGGMSDDVIMAAASSVNDMPSQDRHGQSGPADHTQAPNAISLEQSIAYQQIIARRDAIKAANQARRVPPGDGTGVRPAPKPSASKYESDDDAGWSEDDSDFGYLDDEPLSMSDLIEAL
ncbi:hypothetical protein E5Q_00966 [Mixia osmundae IAM 14324]|uniref:Uncharacterized protein n=2 Tax=Mixia osmundae (strain CBS 9802 / IAM 14324 / JCM 22182 / KY 12970) TaxID=764103 RepID=G7DUQ7_MIXOS|nr:hypothetical protein E5Q_00966 [Mixia osmundae IAM 14324]